MREADHCWVSVDDRTTSGGTLAYEARLLGPAQVRPGGEIGLAGPRPRALLALPGADAVLAMFAAPRACADAVIQMRRVLVAWAWPGTRRC
jgi:hypothetical protein